MTKYFLHRHIQVALFYFFVAATLGAFMRFFSVEAVNWNYKYILHTHSHIALVGWVYTAISSLLYHLFMVKTSAAKAYNRLFLVTQIAILGMMFSFPFQGYAFFSITFSTLYLVATYGFTVLFVKGVPADEQKKPSFKLVRAGLLFLVFSSIGPWALGAIITTRGTDSIWYHNAVYFYLHFMYNGFFIVTLIGVFVKLLEKNAISFNATKFNSFFNWMIASVLISFFLSVLWSDPPTQIYFLAFVGVFIQIIAFYKMFSLFKTVWHEIKTAVSNQVLFVFKFVFVLLVIKLSMQTASAFPDVVAYLNEYKFVTMGYLHLVFLGIITLLLFAFLKHYKLMKCSKPTMVFYIVAFILSEVYLFYGGFYMLLHLPFLPAFGKILFGISVILSLSILIILINNLLPRKDSTS